MRIFLLITGGNEAVEVIDKGILYGDEKVGRGDDSVRPNSEQIMNNTSYTCQRHLTNGHDLQHLKVSCVFVLSRWLFGIYCCFFTRTCIHYYV